jgi:iron uptake system component EfeO
MKLKLLAGAAALALLMSGSARAEVDALALVEPITEYKLYVTEKTYELLKGTTEFVEAVKAGDVEKAKALFARVRMPYEAIEPIAELFSDLDVAIDSRADDYEQAEQDPDFPGFHRI